MPLKLSNLDRDYFKKHLDKAKSLHDKEFKDKANLDLVKAYYVGDDNVEATPTSGTNTETEKVSLNKIHPATNRITPTLYYRNPQITYRPKKGTKEFSAKILTAKVRYDYEEKGVKQTNQNIILDAWYAGFGTCKIGYQTRFAYKQQEDQQPGLMQKIGNFLSGQQAKPDGQEKQIDYIEYEGVTIERIPPQDVHRDPTMPPGKDRLIWIHYNKTLQDIIDAGIYTYDQSFINRFTQKDKRDVEIDLYEGFYRTQEGLFLIAFCDGWQDPVRYVKSSWLGDGFPLEFLSFANINDMYYPPAPLKIALKQQKHINYLATLQMNVIDHFRSQTGIVKNHVTAEGHRTLKENEIGGIVDLKQVTQPIDIKSAPIPADLFNVMGLMQDNLSECLQVSGLRLGSNDSEGTLGQDQIKEFGNQMGTSGMQDRVRDFVINQARKVAQMNKQFATGPVLIATTGLDIINPVTGKPITDEWLEFGTPGNPVTLKDAVAGDYDTDVDIKSAERPNDAVKMKLVENMMNILLNPNIKQQLAAEGKKISTAALINVWLETHKEIVPNVGSIITDLQPQEQDAMGQEQSLMNEQRKKAMVLENESTEIKNANDAAELVAKQRSLDAPMIPAEMMQ